MNTEADELLASLGMATTGGGSKKSKSKNKKDKEEPKEEAAPKESLTTTDDTKEDEASALLAELGLGGGGGEKAKKPKPKKKDKTEKEGGVDEKPVEAPKEKALSKRAKEVLEAQAKARKREEDKAKEEAEIRRLEEEEKQREEEEKLKAEKLREDRKKKKQEQIAKRKELGLPTTKAEKEQAKKRELHLQKLEAGGLITSHQQTSEGGGVAKKELKERQKKKSSSKIQHNQKGTSNAATTTSATTSTIESSKTEKDWDEESDDEDALRKLREQALASTETTEVTAPVVVTTAPKKPIADSKQPQKQQPEKPSRKAPATNTKKSAKKESSSEEESSSEGESSSSSSGSSSSEEDDDDSEEEEEDDEDQKLKNRIALARERRLGRIKSGREEAIKSGKLRSPIICVLGHVDTGKTSILDMLRKTNVQEGEAGGITQQIGATFFPVENVKAVADRLPEKSRVQFKIPGLQVIDTPGHEAFANLRSRGSGLADVVILVIDIMHGLEQQTIESIELLKMRKTRFVVALNKVDRLFNWKVHSGAPIQETLKDQAPNVLPEFQTRVKQVITQLMEQGLNAKLYWENDNYLDTVCLCPTSALTGEGSPDLIATIVKIAQDQMFKRLSFSKELECTVLEVKKIEGLGTTIDVCLVNGELHDNDTVVLASSVGPIVTQIRSLLTPQPMKEMRVKNEYVLHKSIKGAMGVKITCQAELENVVAGTSLFQLTTEDDVEELKDAVMKDVADNLSEIQTVSRGVFVQSSTLGSLEALMVHLKKENVPVAGVQVGDVRKRDVTRASAMLENKQIEPDFIEKEYASILAFDVEVDNAAKDLAAELGIKIFTEKVIYRLTDNYLAYASQLKAERKQRAMEKAVFPCSVKIINARNIFNSKNPLVLGVDVLRGCVVVGTPLVVPDKLVDDPSNPGQKTFLEIGKVIGIEKDRVAVDKAVRGEAVCLKIQGEAHIQCGRHFDETNVMVSKISRKSLDILKAHFKEDIDALKGEGWAFIQNDLKKIFKIQ